MGSLTEFIIDLFSGFAVVGFIAFVVAFLSLIIGYIFEIKEIREEKSNLSSTGIGNALMVLHSMLEPGRKPQTEQVVVIKKRRTPAEKKVIGLSGLEYYNLYIKGYKYIKNKRYKPLRTK